MVATADCPGSTVFCQSAVGVETGRTCVPDGWNLAPSKLEEARSNRGDYIQLACRRLEGREDRDVAPSGPAARIVWTFGRKGGITGSNADVGGIIRHGPFHGEESREDAALGVATVTFVGMRCPEDHR